MRVKENNPPSFTPKDCFKQMLTNLSFKEDRNIGIVLEVSMAANLSLPFQSTRDWDIPHLETRNMCKGLEQSGRFEKRRRGKRLKGIYFVYPQRRGRIV